MGGGGGRLVQLAFEGGGGTGAAGAGALGVELPMANQFVSGLLNLLFEGNDSYIIGFGDNGDGPAYGLPTPADQLQPAASYGSYGPMGMSVIMPTNVNWVPTDPSLSAICTNMQYLVLGDHPARVVQISKKTVKQTLLYTDTPQSKRLCPTAAQPKTTPAVSGAGAAPESDVTKIRAGLDAALASGTLYDLRVLRDAGLINADEFEAKREQLVEADLLKRLTNVYNAGVITAEEFEAKRERLLAAKGE